MCFEFYFPFTHSYRSLNDRWGIKNDRATIFLHSSLSTAFRGASSNLNPVHCDILSSHPFFCLLLPPCTLLCRIILASPVDLNYVPVPSQFAFSHSGDKVFIRPNRMPDSVPHFFIRNTIPVGDAQKTSKASHFCRKYLSL